MKQSSEIIKNVIEDSFPLHKISSDLFTYLEEMSFAKRSKEEYVVSVFNKDSYESLDQFLSVKDDITIISYGVVCRFAKDFYYKIVVGIGTYTPDPDYNAFFTIEKCLVELNYNDDLSLYDIEFYITTLNRVVKK